jgi:hypothetical protein
VIGSARRGALGAGAIALLGAAIAIQAARDSAYPLRAREAERMLYVSSPAALRRMALEFQALASDVYWIRAIQHYGGDRLSNDGRRKYELLQPLLDITTTLDPFFTIAYRFGAIFLSEPEPGGPGRPDEAIALLEKGIRAQPEKWQYDHDIGFVHYWHLQDPAGAAEWFQRAAAKPGAPNWLSPLAASMLSAHDRRSARFLWQQILQSDQPWLRRTAERSLLQLQAMDEMDRLREIVRRAGAGAQPLTWGLLVQRRVLPGVPVDPLGAPYVLDPQSGEVSLSSDSKLAPLPNLSGPLR